MAGILSTDLLESGAHPVLYPAACCARRRPWVRGARKDDEFHHEIPAIGLGPLVPPARRRCSPRRPALGPRSPASVSFSAGAFGLRSGDASRDRRRGAFRPSQLRWLPRFIPELSPATGVLVVHARGRSTSTAACGTTSPLGAPWELSIQFAPGLYSHGSEGFDLGGPVEFRSGIELSRRLGERPACGLLLFHLSNAHIYSHNPGSESLVVT